MNQEPFPKPSPADPLPLEKWLRRTDRAESGREAFFRGRDKEYDTFRSAVLSLNDGVIGGGTMIFQGAPGAGKSALMGECMEAVRCHSTPADPWVAAAIRPETLRSATQFMELLVQAVSEENDRLMKKFPGSDHSFFEKAMDSAGAFLKALVDRGVSIGPISVGAKQAEDNLDSDRMAEWVFSEAAPLLKAIHVVVMVDEAQDTPTNTATRGVVRCLHDPPKQIPLVAAFFGLSDTKHVLRKCGLSRMADERLVNLEALSPEDSVCAIRSVFDAYDFKGTSEDRESWVNSLAKLSRGWPQHINRVSVAAARVIQEQGGHIIMEHLDEALERGKERMDFYYSERLAAGSSREWVYRELALREKEKNGILSVDDIENITEFVREKDSQTLDDFLTKALHAGLLAPVSRSSSRYKIPIPSLGDYLRALDEEPPPQFHR